MNQKIRSAAQRQGVCIWQIANQLGISEPTIYRWLRTPLSKEREDAMLAAIDAIAKEAANAD